MDGAPPHWYLSVWEFLNDKLPFQWIGQKGADNPTVPANTDELKKRITAAIETITPDMFLQL